MTTCPVGLPMLLNHPFDDDAFNNFQGRAAEKLYRLGRVHVSLPHFGKLFIVDCQRQFCLPVVSTTTTTTTTTATTTVA
ncbi:hypothetical protein T07_871 [Trichinella nelsoni]|uniref:Uncharacterized protein n=1 Tax=Trichinella nelsoni TaxID=6336 RepID=A0A0V0RHT7_9BILA|nr:hypothetical protein T07_871 [Trichinella nelsoni]